MTFQLDTAVQRILPLINFHYPNIVSIVGTYCPQVSSAPPGLYPGDVLCDRYVVPANRKLFSWLLLYRELNLHYPNIVFIVGTYCPQGSSARLACTPGMYCETDMLSLPAGNCSAAWLLLYRELNLHCPNILYIIGTNCPQGSSARLACTPGMYCATDMLSQPTGNCSAGYYCTEN